MGKFIDKYTDQIIGVCCTLLCVLGGILIVQGSRSMVKPVPKVVAIPAIQLPATIDKTFVPYITDFVIASRKITPANNQVNVNLQLLTFKFGFPKTIDHDFAAVCKIDSLTVEVDQKEWNKLSQGQKQNLVDHELGHCLLGRTHRHGYTAINNVIYPKSIMYPYVFSGTQYEEEKEELRAELFDPKFFATIFTRVQADYNLRHNSPATYKGATKEERKEIEKILDTYVNGDKTLEESEELIVKFTQNRIKKNKSLASLVKKVSK